MCFVNYDRSLRSNAKISEIIGFFTVMIVCRANKVFIDLLYAEILVLIEDIYLD